MRGKDSEPHARQEEKLLRYADSAKPESQAALVTRRRILLDNAPLSSAVNKRESGRNDFGRTFGVFLIEKTAHGADLMPQPGLSRAVDSGPPFRNSDTLQRRYCICHLPY